MVIHNYWDCIDQTIDYRKDDTDLGKEWQEDENNPPCKDSYHNAEENPTAYIEQLLNNINIGLSP
jgi:hypothetical protein